MILRVLPSPLSGDTVWAPPSKSIMQRAVAIATVADGTTMISRPSESDDCTHALMMAAQLGAEVELGEAAVAINGNFPLAPRTNTITPGESGLGMRLFGTLAALHDGRVTAERKESLLRRDMHGLQDILATFGVTVKGGSPGEELHIQGPIVGGEATLDCSTSSQYLTGLLCTLPLAEKASTLHLTDVVSRPYVDMTLEMLEDAGVDIQVVADHQEDRTMTLHIPCGQRPQGKDIAVDGDWSGAAFLLGLGLLCSPHHLTIEGLHSTYTQADEAIKGALLFGGCRLAGTDEGVQVFAGRPKGFNVDLTDSPDLFPPLAAMAVFAKKPSRLRGLHRLGNKESNRGVTIQLEWKKLGVDVELLVDEDTMLIHPGQPSMGRMSTHGDHRLAMAAALLGAAGQGIEIEGAECVAKSYPAFFDDLEALGIQIQVVAGEAG
jgi:3-phosphoshikimate 1-carboxyvinyltransferase